MFKSAKIIDRLGQRVAARLWRLRWLVSAATVSAIAAASFAFTASYAPAAPHEQDVVALPRAPTTETAARDVWTVACNIFADPANAKNCFAHLTVARQNKRAPTVILALGPDAKGELRFEVEIPTSTRIAEGVALRLDDGAAVKLPIVLCDPASCVASLPLDSQFSAALGEASTAHVSWTSLSAGVVNVDFHVKGARDALAALLR